MSSPSFRKKISNMEKLVAEASFLAMKLWNSFLGRVLTFSLQYRIFTVLIEMSEA